MPLLNDADRAEVVRLLGAMENPVRLINFTQTFECDTCQETHALLEELVATSEKLSLEVLNFTLDKEKAAEYGVDKIPATVVTGDRDYGIRFYGVPAGYEFASLLDAILLVSRRDSGLTPESRQKLAAVTEPVHLQVLVTPT